MSKNDEKPDETPTRLTHVNGGTVVVPAYKAEALVASGSFTAAKRGSK